MKLPYSIQQRSQQLLPPLLVSTWTTIICKGYKHFPPCEGCENIWISSAYLMAAKRNNAAQD